MNGEEMQDDAGLFPEHVRVSEDALEELRARHRLYRVIHDTAAEYISQDYCWNEGDALGDKVIFAAAEEFTSALARAIDGCDENGHRLHRANLAAGCGDGIRPQNRNFGIAPTLNGKSSLAIVIARQIGLFGPYRRVTARI